MRKLSEIVAGGLVLGMNKEKTCFFYNSEDTHSFVLGATRSGKTRRLVLPSIGLTGLAGESMVIIDVKGELSAYTVEFLKREGYEVIQLDFVDPKRSNRYNFLQPVIDATNVGDVPKAVTLARDVATILVPDNGKMERVWTDGARSAITMGILAVVLDYSTKPQYQNLANVREFIATMCTPIGPALPLNYYLAQLPDDSPVRFALAVARIAPSKMRGSFYTQALTALDMFTDPAIHCMTADTDWDVDATGKRKRAIFVILPDHKKTYHPLAALFVQQHYQEMVEIGNQRGGRLERRVHFFCDEFGNFVKINDADVMLTVGAGRGILFNLFLQDVNQLDEKYGDKVGKTIRANCETWVYLQTDDPATLKELSEKLGKYTIKSPSLSSSTSGQASASYNYTGRPLLMPEEIKRIQRPYQLVTSRGAPAVMYMPDVSETIFEKMFGMGDKEHNRRLIMQRRQYREIQPIKTAYATQDWKVYVDIAQAQASGMQ